MTPEEKERNKWIRGYACAVANYINMKGVVDSYGRELFNAGLGQTSIIRLREKGVDENDIEIFEEHWAQLYAGL